MKPYTISTLNKSSLADRYSLLHARDAAWEEVDNPGSVLDATGLDNLRVICSNCGSVLTQDSSCEFIRGALRCPDCGEKFFHVSRMVRKAVRKETSTTPHVRTSAHKPSPARSLAALKKKKSDFFYFDLEKEEWLPATAEELVHRNDPSLLVKIVQDDGTLTPAISYGDLLQVIQGNRKKPRPILGTLMILLGIIPIVISIISETWFYVIAGFCLIGAGFKYIAGEQDD